MEKYEIVEKLNDFLKGIIDIDTLSEMIDDRLFDLRQTSEITEEQEYLSNLELLIHEAKEGFISWSELSEYIKSEVDNKMSEQFITTITINSSFSEEFQTVVRAIPVMDYHLELALV